MAIGFINGEFLDVSQRVLPIDERGHNFGDGVYEMIRAYNGKPFMMEEHLERLENSAAAIRLQPNYTRAELIAYIEEGLQRAQIAGDADIYLQITRGIATRLHTFPDVEALTTMTIRPARQHNPQNWEKGVSACMLVDERWENCFIKALNLLPNLLAKQTAAEQGHYEAILFRDGVVTEGSASNMYCIKDGVLYTHSATKRILHGIVRSAVLRLAREMELEVREEAVTPDFFIRADEAFLTSTTSEVMPIVAVEGHSIGTGQPGPLTRRLHEGYKRLIHG